MRFLNAFFEALFGTAQRCQATLIVLGLGVVVINPGLLAAAANQLIAELMPLLGPALAICIVVGGIRMIVFGKGKK